MSQLTGYSAAELLGLHFADLAHPSQRHLEANLSRLRQPLDHTPAERVRRWVHADGHDLWVRIRTASPRGSAVRGQQVVCHVEAVQR